MNTRSVAAATLNNPYQLLDAAANQSDEGIRLELQFIHGEITEAYAKLLDDCTSANLRKLNGHWAHGCNMLRAVAGKRKRTGRGAK